MKRKWGLTITSLLIALPLMGPAFSTVERELDWDDLIPKSVTFDDPFEALDRETLEYLGFVARVRNMIAAGKELSQATMEELAETEAELRERQIDIDGLLASREKVRDLRMKRASAVVKELDGATVKVPGYLLPLNYSGRKITEFLLVPWVGACIHTPPPPPNQIIHGVLEKGSWYQSMSIYEPVWISGEMKTTQSTKNLFLKDGSNDIRIGYSMHSVTVEKYKK